MLQMIGAVSVIIHGPPEVTLASTSNIFISLSSWIKASNLTPASGLSLASLFYSFLPDSSSALLQTLLVTAWCSCKYWNECTINNNYVWQESWHTQANTTASSALAAEMTNKADVLVAQKDGGMMERTDACGCPWRITRSWLAPAYQGRTLYSSTISWIHLFPSILISTSPTGSTSELIRFMWSSSVS